MIDLKRRGVFTPLSHKKSLPIRPPYCNDSTLFDKMCLECEEKPCGAVCEEAIIKFNKKGSPVLDFSKSGCTFCEACAKVCPEEVLNVDFSSNIKALALIDTASCLAWRGTMCFICKDVCEPNAINFFGLYRPTVNQDCTGCGMCVSICPVGAITMRGIEDET